MNPGHEADGRVSVTCPECGHVNYFRRITHILYERADVNYGG